AKELLCRKRNLESAYSAIVRELESLEQERCAYKSRMMSEPEGEPEQMRRKGLMDTLAGIEDCRLRKSVVERELMMIEKGMSGLNPYQKELLECFFIDRQAGAADDFMDKYFKERSSVYRDRSRALDAFTRSVYGVLSL
ncbi:MAG: hypothetical protein J5793_01240, partial [Clostridia bacterium]|nr:hypothetical protein [Clostridia bacterium]